MSATASVSVPSVRTLPGAVEPDDVPQPSLIPDYLDQHPGMSANRENLLANYSVALHQDHTLQLGYQFFHEQSQRSQYYTLSLFSRLPWNINLTASLNYARNDLWSASVGLSVPIRQPAGQQLLLAAKRGSLAQPEHPEL
ncbi:hypothetical protein OT793_00975 [Edwardsiella ictaluri]|uniref:hypothetical protein n=1 Tax=Edwardsiella ictaluri TaxID=67780 RepID=UPI0037852743